MSIEQVVKVERDGYYAPLYRLLKMRRQHFWARRTHFQGLDFSDEQYQVMADYLGVSVERLKGQDDGLPAGDVQEGRPQLRGHTD